VLTAAGAELDDLTSLFAAEVAVAVAVVVVAAVAVVVVLPVAVLAADVVAVAAMAVSVFFSEGLDAKRLLSLLNAVLTAADGAEAGAGFSDGHAWSVGNRCVRQTCF